MESALIAGFTFPEGASPLSHYIHSCAPALGVKLVPMPAAGAAEQASIVSRLVEQKVDFVLIEEIDSNDEAATVALERAAATGIPVVSICATHKRSRPIRSIPFHKFEGQRALTEHVVERLGSNAGAVAFLAGAGAKAQEDGFRAAISAYPDIESMIVPAAELDRTSTERARGALVTHDLATKHPNLAAILTSNDDLALGVVDALSELGGASRVLVAAFGASPETLNAIRDGTIEASVAQDLGALAKAAIRTGVRAVRSPQEVEETVPFEIVTRANLTRTVTDRFHDLSEVVRDMGQRLDHYRTTSEFLDSVIDNIPLMVFVKEAADLRMIRINKARADWFGIDPKAQLGTTARDNYPKELADRFEASDRAVLEARPDTELPEEHETQSPRGLRYVMTKKFRILDAHGKPSYLVGVSFDVTERKLAELALAQRNIELEEAHRTLQQQQDQLILAEKMASIGRLTAGIAHEMNTPLAAVRGAYSELEKLITEYHDAIGDPDINDHDHREIALEMKRAVQLGAKSAERAAVFVRGIKAQTRELSGRDAVEFNAVTVVTETLGLLSHALRDGRCTVRFEHPETALTLHGSPGGLAQVVTNLVTNAIDATAPRGPGEIVVKLATEDSGVVLRITDRGTGIPPDILDKIFEPMFTTKPFGKGTGLGLPICNDIVTGEFGGRLDVETALGEGTTFIVRFGTK